MLFISIQLTINSVAQISGDNILRRNLFIVKSDIPFDSVPKINITQLRDINIIKKHFGINYNISKSFNELTDQPYSVIVYKDGLKLYVPDGPGIINFQITSNKYLLVLNNRQIIRVGMQLDDFKNIFPVSYSNKRIVLWQNEEKAYLFVLLSFERNNKIYIEDSWISFYFNPKTGELEFFYSIEAP